MKYTHIFFDLGLTLVKLKRAQRYKEVLSFFKVEKGEDEIEKAYHYADKLFMREYIGVLGKNPETFMPWYLGVVNYRLGIKLDLIEVYNKNVEVAKKYKLGWECFEHTINTLKTLKEKGYKLGLISNWNNTCRNVLDENGISEYLDYIFISEEIGVEKPNPDIFYKAFEIANVKPENALYIGDNYYDDVVGCKKVGMDCLLINPYDKFGIEEIDYEFIINDSSKVLEFLEN